MRVTLAAVGRARSEPENALFQHYWRRAQVAGVRLGFTGFGTVIVETSRQPIPERRMHEEAERLTRKSPSATHRIVCDQRGHSLTSNAFAASLAALRDSGTSDVLFVIGGPDGLAAAIRDGAQQRMAFGAQTWPHLLVRAMLAEQIYRALTILSGHPYHRA
jgi:23S rRNA (pseudouridine1915-N3)-methyltransferase